MFCPSCGSQLIPNANYCGRCGQSVRLPMQSTQPVCTAPSPQAEQHISQIENFIQHANPNDRRLGDAYRDAGMAYFHGRNGAPVDKKKAKEYMEIAADRWDGVALYIRGGATVKEAFKYFENPTPEEDGRFLLGVGSMYLHKSHIVGFPAATDMLYHLIRDQGFWPGVTRIEELSGHESLCQSYQEYLRTHF